MAGFLSEVFQAWCNREVTTLLPNGRPQVDAAFKQQATGWLTQALSQLPSWATLNNTFVVFEGFPPQPNEARTADPAAFREGYAFALELSGFDTYRVVTATQEQAQHAFDGHVELARQSGLQVQVGVRLYDVVDPTGVPIGSYVSPFEIYCGRVSLTDLLIIGDGPASPSPTDIAVAQTILSFFPQA
jgi:hypothetical protein